MNNINILSKFSILKTILRTVYDEQCLACNDLSREWGCRPCEPLKVMLGPWADPFLPLCFSSDMRQATLLYHMLPTMDGTPSHPTQAQKTAESSDQGPKSLKLGAFFCKLSQVIWYGCSNSASKSRSRESGKWVLLLAQVSSLGWRRVVQCCGAAVLREETASRLFTPLPGPVRSMAVTITSPGSHRGEYTFKEWKL